MNYIMNKIKELINKIKRYIRYLRICDALGVKLVSWQKNFVLYNKPFLDYINGRKATGKTMAVLIRLMLDTDWHTTKPEVIKVLMNDKDYVLTYKDTAIQYQNMYDEMRQKCLDKGIKVSKINFIGLNETKDW